MIPRMRVQTKNRQRSSPPSMTFLASLSASPTVFSFEMATWL